ncbi:hypothetical protein CLCR_09344 [Cladophialophora carrionii]|uniref:Uncharacterized protein n=1 Tax=Cladophialophora carrionii TaxID=86049 RepID=A0A1C1CRI4_9EURO|nr:hypothetical protein CLCR_09344 [Cladophialophora carrionii]
MPSSSGVGGSRRADARAGVGTGAGALMVRRDPESVERITLAERARNHQPCFFALGVVSVEVAVAVAALEAGEEEEDLDPVLNVDLFLESASE